MGDGRFDGADYARKETRKMKAEIERLRETLEGSRERCEAWKAEAVERKQKIIELWDENERLREVLERVVQAIDNYQLADTQANWKQAQEFGRVVNQAKDLLKSKA